MHKNKKPTYTTLASFSTTSYSFAWLAKDKMSKISNFCLREPKSEGEGWVKLPWRVRNLLKGLIEWFRPPPGKFCSNDRNRKQSQVSVRQNRKCKECYKEYNKDRSVEYIRMCNYHFKSLDFYSIYLRLLFTANVWVNCRVVFRKWSRFRNLSSRLIHIYRSLADF